MNISDELRLFFKKLTNEQKPKQREMKRVFQWRRYIEWKDLTFEEKLSAKRILFVPIFAYLIVGIFNQYFLLIVLLIIGYVLYKRFEKGSILKK